MLQLRVQKELLDVWTVKYVVGASYSYETHTGYFQMSRESAVKCSICDCFSGYVVQNSPSDFGGVVFQFIFLCQFFSQFSRMLSSLRRAEALDGLE